MWSESDDSLYALLWQVIRQHFLRHRFLLSRIGLYKGQPPILALLWNRDGLTQKEIAEALGLKPPTVTVILRRMEKAGLLRRRTDTQDMRVLRVYLTEKGRALRKDVEEINKILEEECFAGFPLEEKALLRKFLIQIRDNLKRVNEDGEPDESSK
ncbi:MAG: MarR family winged helix-turn-helix transcriptional regulator [Candidatus Caldatribacteriaceae bacterium]